MKQIEIYGRTYPMNRMQLYSAITTEMLKHNPEYVFSYLRKTFKTDKFAKLDLNELEAMLLWLKGEK